MTKIPLCIQPLPGIGDMVWFLPHMRAIAHAHTSKKLYILTKKSSLADQLLENEPWVTGFIWLERDHRSKTKAQYPSHDGILGRWRLAQELKRYGFNEAWSLHHGSYYRQVMALANIKHRHGYSIGSSSWLLSHPIILSIEYRKQHFRAQVSAFLERCGYELAPFHKPLGISPFAARNVLQKFGAKSKPRIAFGIGASGIEKIWPAEKFAQLATSLSLGCQICLCGGPSEQPIAQKIQHLYSGKEESLVNATNLPLQQSMALLATCDLYIGNDTSLMNLAVNQGIQTIAIFGPTYTVYSDLIIPLMAADRCIDSIPVEAVLNLIERQNLIQRVQS
jgi:heptosyltransferase-2